MFWLTLQVVVKLRSAAQAGEEQRMWGQLADTACQQLRSIGLKYDGHVRGVMTTHDSHLTKAFRAVAHQTPTSYRVQIHQESR